MNALDSFIGVFDALLPMDCFLYANLHHADPSHCHSAKWATLGQQQHKRVLQGQSFLLSIFIHRILSHYGWFVAVPVHNGVFHHEHAPLCGTDLYCYARAYLKGVQIAQHGNSFLYETFDLVTGYASTSSSFPANAAPRT
jgi:hypothetical protein